MRAQAKLTGVADPVHVKRFDRAIQSIQEIVDPLDRLDVVRASRERLERLEAESVAAARAGGATWRDVGGLYGLSKQGAQQRFQAAVKGLGSSDG